MTNTMKRCVYTYVSGLRVVGCKNRLRYYMLKNSLPIKCKQRERAAGINLTYIAHTVLGWGAGRRSLVERCTPTELLSLLSK